MKLSLPLIQLLLLILWYAVPAMASVPAWIIFLPLTIIGIVLLFVLFALILAAMGVASR